MLFIAPVISTSLMAHHCDAHSVAPGINQPTASPLHSGMAHAHAHPADEPPAHAASSAACPAASPLHHILNGGASSPMEDIACGYCQLLIHLPIIVWVFVPLIWLTLRISRMPPARTPVGPVLPRSYADFFPRAPPANRFIPLFR